MNKQKNNAILTGTIYKQILLFFFPILLGSFFQQLYSATDAIIVGRFVNKEALAAIGTTAYLISILIGFFVGLSAGAAVIISQLYGADKSHDLNNAVHTAVALSIVGGVAVMIIGFIFSPFALKAINAPADIFDKSLVYIRVYFMGAVPILLYNMGSSILRAVGDSKSPLYVLIASTICNIFLDILFVAVLKTGVFGAALATLFSQSISAFLTLLILSRTELSYKLDFKKVKFHGHILGNMLKLGLPTGFQSTLFLLSNVIIQSAVNGFGTNMVAAWTAFTNIDNMFWMVSAAFGISITTFVGQNFGAGNFDRIKKGVKITLLFTAASSVFLSIVFYIFCRPLLMLYSSDKTVIDTGVSLFRHYCQYYIFFVGIEILSGGIRGTGDTLIPTIITAVGVCLLRILWIFIAVPLKPEIETVIFSYPMTWLITSAVFTAYYLHGGWLRRRKKAMGF